MVRFFTIETEVIDNKMNAYGELQKRGPSGRGRECEAQGKLCVGFEKLAVFDVSRWVSCVASVALDSTQNRIMRS